jgi:8-hydroxy-5-deazaflavin:NADPH oxidoreductase
VASVAYETALWAVETLKALRARNQEVFMRIAIIGAASVGATLGRAWIKHGEDVIWGLRNAADPKHASLPKERVKAPAEAVKEAEVVVMATPWSAAEVAIKSLGSLAGKTVIDCMNPLGMGPDGLQLVLGFNTSAGEQVASWAPAAFVFKTLNTTGAGNMAKAADYRVKPVMLVAGDDANRKPAVMELVAKAVDVGPLKNARLLEPLAMLWIDQAMKRGRGREFAFALVNMR